MKISVKEHRWTTVKTDDATCTDDGKLYLKCANCPEEKTEDIVAMGHISVTDNAVSATCTTAGKTEGAHCSVCNTVLKSQENVPAKGHTAVTDKGTTATCTTSGKTEGTHCSVCNAVIKVQENIPATDHKWDNGKVTTAATCKAKGVKTYVCQNDSAHTKTENIDVNASNHVNTKTVAEVKATCTKVGYTAGVYCNDCQQYISGHQETTKNTSNHVNTKTVSETPATFDKVGYTAGVYCIDCQKYISGHKEIPVLMNNIGDVDGDGQITSSDARLALRAAVGLDALSDAQKKTSDADSDGQVTSSDARLILRAAVGLEELKKRSK